MRRLRTGLLCALLALPLPGHTESTAEPSLEEVLEGFSEPAPSSELEDALSGFDDEPPLDPALEQALEGFDDSPDRGPTETPAVADSPHQLNGSLGMSAAYAFAHSAPQPGAADYRGLTRLRGRFDLEYAYHWRDWRLHAEGHAWYDPIYDWGGRDYPAAVTDEFRHEAELGELWLRSRLDDRFDLKLGRQIVVWGKSDNLRITDVLNPLDQREPGMVDIEDLRLPVAMSRLDYYQGPWNLTGLLIHEVRFDKLPPPGAEFSPFSGPLPPESEPASSLKHTQYALALNGVFSGWDLSLYAADLYDRNAYLTTNDSGMPVRRHARIEMLGAALNIAQGNWLWKIELAHLRNLRLTGVPGERLARSDLLLGVEYAGFTNASLSFELTDRHLHDYDRDRYPAGPSKNNRQAAIRYQKDFLHDRLHLVTLLAALEAFDSDGGFGRASLEYEVTDALNLTTGLMVYRDGEKLELRQIGDNDRVFLELEYSF